MGEIPNDEGATAMRIGVHKGNLIIDFGKPTVWIGFHYKETQELIKILRTRMAELHPVRAEYAIHSKCCGAHWELQFKDGVFWLACEKCGTTAGEDIVVTGPQLGSCDCDECKKNGYSRN